MVKVSNRKHRGTSARVISLARTLGLAAALCLGAGVSAQADTPGQHPHYLHALSDLRYARALLYSPDEQNVMRDENRAIIEIDRAITEIKQASIDDGKNLEDHPRVDANLSHKDRLRKAVVLLGSAHHDLAAYKEDDQVALGWRQRALSEIDGAYKVTQKAVRDDYRDDHPRVPGAHPEYLRAISDLRMARKLLSFPDEGNVMADERQAGKFITEAIRGAKRAAIDDGQDIFTNPPADNNLPRHDRLRQAARLLHDTYNRLMNAPEMDRGAQGVLYNTLFNVNKAIGFADKAIRDDRRDDQ